MVLVLRRINQCDRAPSCAAAQLSKSFDMASKLEAVSAAKFLPAANSVAKPAPQLGARRKLTIPLIKARFLPAQSAGPQPVDKHSRAVFVFSRLISTLDFDANRGGQHAMQSHSGDEESLVLAM